MKFEHINRNAAIKQALKLWDTIPMSALYAFEHAARGALEGKPIEHDRRELAMEMGAAAARGDDVGAANIKAMLLALG